MSFDIRPAVSDDYPRLIEIAAEGDAPECDAQYLAFVAQVGRLLCAMADGDVVAFGGMVPAGDVAMVTDLFVAATARAQGIGGQILGALLDGWPRHMTFSSQHPGALAAYQRAGMHERGRMLYVAGSAIGGGESLIPGAWAHDRDDLVDYFASRGALVTANCVVSANDDGIEVLRVDSESAIEECERILRAFDAGTTVRLYVPTTHPLAVWLLLIQKFKVKDMDEMCSSGGVELPPTLAALHPGLA